MSAFVRRSVLGRADLVATLARAGADQRPDATARYLADALGLEWLPPQPEVVAPLAEAPPVPAPVPAEDQPRLRDAPPQDIPFWRAESLEYFDDISDPPEPAKSAPYQGWRQRPRTPPPFQPLATWAELVPRLRRALSDHHEGRAIDLDLTVRRISQGHILESFPRERRRRWGPALLLIEDDSRRLIPYRADKRLVRWALRRLLPAHGLTRAVMDEYRSCPELLEADAHWPPPPGTRVLVLGDLGCLARQGDRLRQHWLDLGRALRDAGCDPLALLPAPLSRCPPDIAAVWRLIPWERPRPAHDGADLEARAERLLRLAAPASRIEPGLLRAIRLLLPEDQADAGTEADVWQHPALCDDSAAAATLALDRAQALRRSLAQEPGEEARALRRQLIRTIRNWRWRDGRLPEEIWFDELLNFDPQALRGEGDGDLGADLDDARRYFAEFCADHPDPAALAMPGPDRAWLGRVTARSTEHLWNDAQFGPRLLELAVALRPDDPLPPGVGVRHLPHRGRPERAVQLVQVGSTLTLVPAGEAAHGAGSPLATLRTRNGLVEIGSSDDRNAFWETGVPPAWAKNWGWDEFGAWVTFEVAGRDGGSVAQRMRWIPPGQFQMGSPEDEPERWDDEGPRHPVTIRDGFWLFDTACSQALWSAVMGENPSRFQDPRRPVEKISWDDAQSFIQALNQRLPGLSLGLPSEAQWEYACRAGTDTPFSFGANISPEQANYNGDYPYAGGEKGKNRQETVPVGSLPPNPWGLYEMHGNVREWVQDTGHDNYAGAPPDGSAWESSETSAARVIRGGSWLDGARVCRSAVRIWNEPDSRGDYLGFRCARVQAGEPGGRDGASGALEAAAARPAERIRPGGNPEPVLLRADSGISATAALPAASTTIQIVTDRQRLILRRRPKPRWARAMGRDGCGLWADLAVEPQHGPGEPAIQRLRWIPPGPFLMGSPEDEPGRWGDEGPRHPVTLAEGYWLFDTPCTQALWVAVLGDNPSRFQDPRRPVEQVSWDQIQRDFLPALNRYVGACLGDDSGRFVLPSEAQWEYACRAGTDTALYTGGIEILGDMDAPALDPIAWYGGNSGKDYDLDEAEDSTTGWWEGKQKQYPHQRAGTRQVRGKAANAWGLYDMLGNVWEWTEDVWHGRHEDAPPDGRARVSDEAGAARVIRGGSWYDHARYCRSASRSRLVPDSRVDFLGFRCARVQA